MVDIVPGFLHGLITVSYILIAGKFFYALRYDNKASRACAYFVAIFVLCGLSGYARHIIPGYPWWLADTTHVLLIIASWGFIITGQINTIAQKLNEVWRDGD